MNDLREEIVESNPWWRGNAPSGYSKRDIEDEIESYIDKRQIVAVTGLRRCGKTTLFYRIVNSLLEEHDASKIFYFSFDGFQEVDLREMLDIYSGINSIDVEKDRVFVFLDEVQKLEDWQNKVKRLYDRFENIKFFVSGSESLFFRKSKESLAGRIFEFRLGLLSFREYLRFKEVEYKENQVYSKELRRHFEHYMLTSGFPELVDVEDREVIERYLRDSVVEKVIFRDIPGVFSVGNPSELEAIFNILVDRPGQTISVQSISNDLGISRQTVSKYLKYLEMSYIVRKTYNYSKSGIKRERKLKKYYPAVPSLTLLKKEGRLSRSKVFEGVLASCLDAEFFWRDSRKNEVDILLESEGSLLPIEVKYSDRKEVSGIHEFMEEFDVSEGIVVTESLEDTEDMDGRTVEFVPAWKAVMHSDDLSELVNLN